MENDGLTPGGSIELEHVGQGTQSYVFGTDRWVVTVRKMSLLGSLARLVTRKQWLGEVRDHLGGLAAPFLLLDDVEFRAPKMTGRYKIIDYRKKMAVARERYETDDFLDHRLSLSDPERALELVEEMVELVERVRARGFYMHDFIMRNFALVDGKLMIVDPGFIASMASSASAASSRGVTSPLRIRSASPRASCAAYSSRFMAILSYSDAFLPKGVSSKRFPTPFTARKYRHRPPARCHR